MSIPETAQDIDVGTIVADTYRIVRILGRGGMGTVWEAEHMRLPGKQVAIKVLHASVVGDADSLARFRREAEIACRLGHPNIVDVHDFNELENGSPYLILELLEGMDLEAKLRGGPLSAEMCEHVLRQVGSALQSAHEQGVIHRDLKPQNIFLEPSLTGVGPDTVKVLDFGISKIQGSLTVQTQDTTLLGTPQYMAPEQARGDHDHVDGRTDLFSLAAMFYELLSGKPAFGGKSIPEVVYKVVHAEPIPLREHLPDLAPHYITAIHKALSKAQDDRYTNISDFVEAFTGSPLPPTRVRRASQLPEFAVAETLDSARISLGIAMTVDSQNIKSVGISPSKRSGTNVAQGVTGTDRTQSADISRSKNNPGSALAIAATIDSQNIDIPQITPKATLDVPALVAVAATKTLAPGGENYSHDNTGPGTQIRYAIAAAVLAAGAVAAFFLTRGPDSTSPVASVEPDAAKIEQLVVALPLDASIQMDANTIEMRTLDAALLPVDASLPLDARKKHQTKVQTKVQTKIQTTSSTNPDLERYLKEASTALKAGNARATIQATKNAKQYGAPARLYEIEAKAFCLLKDLSKANGALRRTKGARERSVRKFCKKHNFLLIK